MAVVISEILTEVVVTSREAPDGGAAAVGAGGPGAAGGGLGEDAMDAVVRRATERVLEVLRREWDR
jgi:hypothetical protein